MAALIAGMVGCDGTTTARIRTWYDLNAVRNNLGGTYLLMNDLDSNTAGYEELASETANGGKGWEPIGTRSAPFTGSFNGQEYEIRDLFINLPEEELVPFGGNECVGLFGVVDVGGRIEDIGVVNADVTGSVSVGGLVGEIEHGTVSNSYSTGSVAGYNSVGGLVGRSYDGTVSDSYSTGSVTGDENVGGLVGWSWGDVSNSYYNYDEVLINGEKVITIGALFGEDFDQWLANDKFLDVNERLSQESGYYVINDVADFKQLLAFAQDGLLKFRLKNDLDLAIEPDFYIPYLAGEFDGNGHKISNLSFNSDFVYTVGLFGYLAPGGKVTQVGVENVNITGDNLVGGLVGINYEGTVSNSYSTGSVAGYHNCLGGLVGWNRGDVTNSYSTGNVTRAGYGSLYVGGLMGYNEYGTVSNSYSTSNVTGSMYVGGLVGVNEFGTVSNSCSTSSVVGKEIVGGLVGQNRNTVGSSYSTGSVTGEDFVGGLVGENVGDVSSSYSTGIITGSWYVGGLVGQNSYGTVSDSYSTGSVSGDWAVGGLVGVHYGDTVSDSYSTGSVTGDEWVGGLVGVNGGFRGGGAESIVSNSYYNCDEVLINGDNIITIGALFDEDFDQWLANDKFLDVNERLSQEDSYYVINDVSDFKELLIFGEDNSLKFRLKNDLDLATESDFYIPYFAGELDGNGHKISNLSFNFDFISQVGLFGYLASGGKVSQVGAETVTITGANVVGGLVGDNDGTVSRSYSTGSVSGNWTVGGLVGENDGTVSNSYSTCSVTVHSRQAGGLVGFNDDGIVSNSYSTGSVIGSWDVGGLVGTNGAAVSDSFWDTETSGQATSDGGTGKNTVEMQDVTTFSGAGWNIIAVVGSGERNTAYIWNIVDDAAYPFLSWEP